MGTNLLQLALYKIKRIMKNPHVNKHLKIQQKKKELPSVVVENCLLSYYLPI